MSWKHFFHIAMLADVMYGGHVTSSPHRDDNKSQVYFVTILENFLLFCKNMSWKCSKLVSEKLKQCYKKKREEYKIKMEGILSSQTVFELLTNPQTYISD